MQDQFKKIKQSSAFQVITPGMENRFRSNTVAFHAFVAVEDCRSFNQNWKAHILTV